MSIRGASNAGLLTTSTSQHRCREHCGQFKSYVSVMENEPSSRKVAGWISTPRGGGTMPRDIEWGTGCMLREYNRAVYLPCTSNLSAFIRCACAGADTDGRQMRSTDRVTIADILHMRLQCIRRSSLGNPGDAPHLLAAATVACILLCRLASSLA